MRVGISTALLGLAWFVVVNAAVSLVAIAWSRTLDDTVAADPGRARRLLVIRFVPFVTAAVVAAALFAPAHARLEPAVADEAYGLLLLTLAATGATIFLRSALRVGAVTAASFRLSAWIRAQSRAVDTGEWIETRVLPGIALAGVIRPRVLIGTRARQVLSAAELEVAVAHERAHQRSWDNLARVLMRCVPDLFGGTSAGRRVERLWEAEAECLADARAAQGSQARARRLASALLKIARLAGRSGYPRYGSVWSTFHQPALLETRIRLLVGETSPDLAPRHQMVPWMGLAVALIAAAWFSGLPVELHYLTERLVEALP
jgi:hypothetical protein